MIKLVIISHYCEVCASSHPT